MTKWIVILAAALVVVFIVMPMLGGTTRLGLVAPGGGNGTGAEHVNLV